MKNIYMIIGIIVILAGALIAVTYSLTNKVATNACLKQYNTTCDYYECMGNRTSTAVTASMYYSQKTNCLIRGE
jgi:hypothetical protein